VSAEPQINPRRRTALLQGRLDASQWVLPRALLRKRETRAFAPGRADERREVAFNRLVCRMRGVGRNTFPRLPFCEPRQAPCPQAHGASHSSTKNSFCAKSSITGRRAGGGLSISVSQFVRINVRTRLGFRATKSCATAPPLSLATRSTAKIERESSSFHEHCRPDPQGQLPALFATLRVAQRQEVRGDAASMRR